MTLGHSRDMPSREVAVVDRRTLRFLDPQVEAAYQRAAAVSVHELRVGQLSSVAFWLVGGALAAVATSAPPVPIYAVATGMAIASGLAAVVAPQAVTYERQQRMGAGLNALAGIAVLALAALTGTFDFYAAPALILTAFALIATRMRFALALMVSVVYIAAYAAFAFSIGSTPNLLDIFLVTTMVLAALGTTYTLEAARRQVFAQGRVIAELHQQVDAMFRRYLSPTVASALLETGGDTLGGEVVRATILFADLQGFTSLSERSNPRAVVDLLNTYFEAAVPAIFAQGGSIIGFAGDAVMAVFNAPQPQPDHALRAARAALALQAAVEALPITGTRPRFRVGLNTGDVLVGSIGSQDMRNFAAIGDATNVAARLQAYAQAGHVVVGHETVKELGACAEVIPLGTPALKGKTEAVAVYQLVSLCEEPNPS